MKKRKIYMGLLFIAMLAFSVVFIQLNMDANSKVEKGKDVDAITDSHEKIEKMLGEMTLEEKVGQLMMVGFRGTEKSSEITELIEQKHIGGVIYFDRNMKSPEQVAKLSNSLQQTADQSTLSLPLMVAVDQEGGNIIRMRERVSPLPSQQDLGKNASVEDMYKVAKLNGAELGSMGININFAPVLDLSKTDERSLGKDPEKVYQYGKKAIQGLNDVSITGALKHFPGNGRSEIDPHVETSSVEANQLDLENSDIYPFKQIISEMDNQKFFVMVTHIKYPAYDKEKPASLSKVIIEDLLRGKLKYEGLVVTDDLEMGAVNKYFSYEDMGKQAILAGADLLLVCHEYSHELEVYNGLLKAAKTGEVPMEKINESVKRVLTYKLFNMKQTKADPDQAEKVVKSPESMNYIESLNLDK
ncbi:beta-N-acetylhexosaminidase [Peribacillus sp. ACCC06369]|uniref:beta-N-acetylhexosaminidase n=1 Tax=Peribacillus sp. ACCC06369 TaxID=3055860 RepID=UPI0025A00A60|nr:beta-N-acetylhexosaminidase [Peribacillus sp. ACCC06369]MDM5360966.1 beta-N-acetylhexosaminidase [Peribacillus sp. ACCC06369]